MNMKDTPARKKTLRIVSSRPSAKKAEACKELWGQQNARLAAFSCLGQYSKSELRQLEDWINAEIASKLCRGNDP